MQTHMRLEIIVNDVVLQLSKELKKDDDGDYNDEKETGNRSNKVVKTQHSESKCNQNIKKPIHCIIIQF